MWIFFVLMAWSHSPPAPTVKMNYICRGISPGGEYRTALTVTQSKEDFYFSWDNGDVGVGSHKGNWMPVYFVNKEGVKGSILYEVAYSQLIGHWMIDEKHVYTETCREPELRIAF